MPDELVISQCSPTMAGLKTGSLFSCPAEDRRELIGSLKRLNTMLVPKGARIIPVRIKCGRALLYMYRPSRLSCDLKNEAATRILEESGYPSNEAGKCLSELVRRLGRGGVFPHEIGLFLGYPPEDVAGFIRCGSKTAKLSGPWKVYGDEKKARMMFDAYGKCTRLYREAYRRHNSFDRLVVSCHR